MSEKKSIVKINRIGNYNIGVVIFFIIIFYVIFNIFSYFTKTHIAEYQVQQGTIASNYVYQGIILRDETVEYAPTGGYINYYVKNTDKVSVTDVVYSIDTTGAIHKKLTSAANKDNILSSDNIQSLSGDIETFIKDYNSNQFAKSYTFLNNITTELTQDINYKTLNLLSTEVEEAIANNTFYQMTSPSDGVIVYEIDGFENYTVEDIAASKISYSNYKETYLFTNKEVKKNAPVYKRINSEKWNVLIQIDSKLYLKLKDNTSIQIRFHKDGFTTNAASKAIYQNGSYFLELTLNTGMVRYANDRFIDVELVLGDRTGLKIPQSSITSKEFFTVPKDCFSLGGDSDNQVLLIRQTKNGESSVKMVTPTIYYETDKFFYIDNEHVSDGDIVLKPDSSSTYKIGNDKASLVGVYNINKGYAVFKQINILYENKDYAIVETKTAYGIALYDHIALNASTIVENQLTSK